MSWIGSYVRSALHSSSDCSDCLKANIGTGIPFLRNCILSDRPVLGTVPVRTSIFRVRSKPPKGNGLARASVLLESKWEPRLSRNQAERNVQCNAIRKSSYSEPLRCWRALAWHRRKGCEKALAARAAPLNPVCHQVRPAQRRHQVRQAAAKPRLKTKAGVKAPLIMAEARLRTLSPERTGRVDRLSPNEGRNQPRAKARPKRTT